MLNIISSIAKKLSSMKIETILSIIAIAISIFTETKNRKFRQKTFDYDVQKETTRQLEKRTDDIYTRLNSRSSLIPFFIISLKGSKGSLRKNRYDNSLNVELCLRNIGKESAVNVDIVPYSEECQENIKIENFDEYKTETFAMLTNNSAMINEHIFLYMSRDLTNIDINEISDTFFFRITFRDLIGNLYSQNFRAGYSVFDKQIKFVPDNYSSVPMLIKENIKIE